MTTRSAMDSGVRRKRTNKPPTLKQFMKRVNQIKSIKPKRFTKAAKKAAR